MCEGNIVLHLKEFPRVLITLSHIITVVLFVFLLSSQADPSLRWGILTSVIQIFQVDFQVQQ